MIQAIETSYGGYLFRSRLEARWAVLFDALDIDWQYEPQGYYVGDQQRPYLPDFRLRDGIDEFWVEVKGDVERLDYELLTAAAHDSGALLVLGPVPDVSQNAFAPMHPILYPGAQGLGTQVNGVAFTGSANSFKIWVEWLHPTTVSVGCAVREMFSGERSLTDKVGGGPNRGLSLGEDVRAAYRAARSARFEHGQFGGML